MVQVVTNNKIIKLTYQSAYEIKHLPINLSALGDSESSCEVSCFCELLMRPQLMGRLFAVMRDKFNEAWISTFVSRCKFPVCCCSWWWRKLFLSPLYPDMTWLVASVVLMDLRSWDSKWWNLYDQAQSMSE